MAVRLARISPTSFAVPHICQNILTSEAQIDWTNFGQTFTRTAGAEGQ